MKHRRIKQECWLTILLFCVHLTCGRGSGWMQSWTLRGGTSGSLWSTAEKGLLSILSITAAQQTWHSFQGADVQDTWSHLFPQPAQCVYCRNVLPMWELQLLLSHFKLLFNYCSLLFLIGGLMMLHQTLTGNWPGLEERDFMTWKTIPAQKMRRWIGEDVGSTF